MKPMIRVEGLGKRYLLGAPRPAYATLREAVAGALRSPLRRRGRGAGGGAVWALRGVSFEVGAGEVVGVIGRNGAGKSTLLKVLSRITEPSEGGADLYGRVGSLLEVGTGFHPELTGRENVFLNGAVLGMGRREIGRKFDEIVEFAGVGGYVDAPVKRYSTGMYMRLAFAVAAHLEPEVLVVDEVLAVGDAAFQRKCLGKMGEAAREGRTVLFVSHNMGAISALCGKVVWLDHGRLINMGAALEIVEAYLSSLDKASECSLRDRTDRDGTGKARFTSAFLSSREGAPLQEILSGYECMLVLGYESSEPLNEPRFKFTIYGSAGLPLAHFDSSLTNTNFNKLPKRGQVACRLGRLPLSEGGYRLNVSVEDDGQLLDHVTAAYSFHVGSGNFYGTGRNIIGIKEVCLIDQEWAFLDIPSPAIIESVTPRNASG
jgi:lipopolysaccharide transport system ATP-binding protein